MKDLTSLFLSQAYNDTWDDYCRSLLRDNFVTWDYIVLTASDEKQAEGFTHQIETRRKGGFLPKNTKFFVLPDPENRRVGSGGATLSVIKTLGEDIGSFDFHNKRILVIHSGGDSKRVPQYSALGKLFSPVPHTLPDGRASTLFDEFLITMSSVPTRIKEGMLLLSGDVLLLFNPLQIDFQGVGAAAISFKENVQTGKNHGVFLNGEDGFVKKFLHKLSEEELRSFGAVNEQDAVDIDTGAIIFSPELLSALASIIVKNGKVDKALFKKYVNDRVRLSLYGDFLYPLASDSALKDFYTQAPEGEMCESLLKAREVVFDKLNGFSLKLLRLAPAKFIHLGTTREILKLLNQDISKYADLSWTSSNISVVPKNASGYNSIVETCATVLDGSYFESSYVRGNSKIGKNSLLSFIEVNNADIPDDVVLHALKTRDGKFQVRMFGTCDNPKATVGNGMTIFGEDFSAVLKNLSLNLGDFFEDGATSLWEAKLYPLTDTIGEGVDYALSLYNIVKHQKVDKNYLSKKRESLVFGFHNADPIAVTLWDKRMCDLVSMGKLYIKMLEKVPASELKGTLKTEKLSKIQETWLKEKLGTVSVGEQMRLYYYIALALGGLEEEKYKQKFFSLIKEAVNDKSAFSYDDKCKIVMQNHTVKMPLRVNFGGGWSDTPPYCNENGGTVLNAAILLNGEMPVTVTLTKIPEKKIIFESRDMGTYFEFTSLLDLQKTGDPYDPYALQKSALIATGIIPEKGGDFNKILTRFGGGFKMQSEVTGVPKGSGLGTSSILAGASAKALCEFFGLKKSLPELYDCVLKMEQIMSTGGGWQDQVGGMKTGLKLITSRSGLHQELKVNEISLDQDTLEQLDQRFCLIYTGQRRLARNLLRDVIGNYIGNEKSSIYALEEIQKLAVLMQFELSRGNIDGFSNLLNKHWELSKMIDKGSTNTLIDSIFDSVEDLIDGKMICGAGGGGFLQVVLKKDVKKSTLKARLRKIFQDNAVDLWDTKFI